MNKFEEYLEYEGAFVNLAGEKGLIDKRCDNYLSGINERLDYFDNQESNLQQRLDNLRRQKYELKRKRVLLLNQFDNEKKELEGAFDQKYDNEYVSISVRDFKEVFSDLTCTSLDKIKVKLDFEYPIFSFEKLDNSFDVAKSYIDFLNSSHRLQYDLDRLFQINVEFEFDGQKEVLLSLSSLYEIENDGKLFLEHCSPCVCDGIHYRSRLVIDKDIDDVMINIRFKDLANNFYEHDGLEDEIKSIVKNVFIKILEKQSDKGEKRISLK